MSIEDPTEVYEQISDDSELNKAANSDPEVDVLPPLRPNKLRREARLRILASIMPDYFPFDDIDLN